MKKVNQTNELLISFSFVIPFLEGATSEFDGEILPASQH